MQQSDTSTGTLRRMPCGCYHRVPSLREQLDLFTNSTIFQLPTSPQPKMVIINLQAPDGTPVEFTPSHGKDDELTAKNEPNSSYITISFRDAAGTLCRCSFDRKLLADLDTTV